jgi:hypothetical protein
MATPTPFSIPFSGPYTLNEDIKFRKFYTGEPLHYVQKRVIGYDADQLIIGVQSKGQKERKVIFNISPGKLQLQITGRHFMCAWLPCPARALLEQ